MKTKKPNGKRIKIPITPVLCIRCGSMGGTLIAKRDGKSVGKNYRNLATGYYHDKCPKWAKLRNL